MFAAIDCGMDADAASTTFTVNVRQPEGEPIQNVSAGTPGLDLYFHGNAGALPQLRFQGTVRRGTGIVFVLRRRRDR